MALKTLVQTNRYSEKDRQWMPEFVPDLDTNSPLPEAETKITKFFNEVSAFCFPTIIYSSYL